MGYPNIIYSLKIFNSLIEKFISIVYNGLIISNKIFLKLVIYMNSKKQLNYHMKIRVYFDNPSFGPGVTKIMELVKGTGSLSEAYRKMGLSSSKGWRIIKNAEEDLGFPLFLTVVGGQGGGQTELSKEGEDLLHRYQAFVEEMELEADRLFDKYFK